MEGGRDVLSVQSVQSHSARFGCDAKAGPCPLVSHTGGRVARATGLPLSSEVGENTTPESHQRGSCAPHGACICVVLMCIISAAHGVTARVARRIERALLRSWLQTIAACAQPVVVRAVDEQVLVWHHDKIIVRIAS